MIAIVFSCFSLITKKSARKKLAMSILRCGNNHKYAQIHISPILNDVSKERDLMQFMHVFEIRLDFF